MGKDWQVDGKTGEKFYYDWKTYEYVYENGVRYNRDGYQVWPPIRSPVQEDSQPPLVGDPEEHGTDAESNEGEESEESDETNESEDEESDGGDETDEGEEEDEEQNSGLESVVDDFADMEISSPHFDSSDDGSIQSIESGTSMLFPPEPLQPDRYETLSSLGKGNQASVNECKDLYDKNIYAVKGYTLSKGRSDSNREKIQKEVALMAQLSHDPHAYLYIVRLVRWHEEDNQISLVMTPAASDGSLAKLLRKQFNNPNEEVLTDDFLGMALTNLCAGLEFIHQWDIRHKDVKPWNIVIHHGRPIYTDFGISIPFDRSVAGDTGHSEARDPTLFTYNKTYTAPELLEEEGSRSTEADIFSLGCVFWDILAARAFYLTRNPTVKKMTVLGRGIKEYGHAARDGTLSKVIINTASEDAMHMYDYAFEQVQKMLAVDPLKRPSLAHVGGRVFAQGY